MLRDNMHTAKIQKALHIGIKIFFIGMILQFIAHTFITYTVQRENTLWSVIRAWKEIWILLAGWLILYTWYQLHKENKLQESIKHFPLKKYTFITILTLIFIIIIGLATGTPLWATIMSMRYSMTWFVLFIMGTILAGHYETIWREKRYIKFIKYLLIGWLIRRWLIYFLPSFIELFWYNKYIFEWQVGQQPPAVYYSNINQGMVRNQFLFERPIHRWMFLILFWPLFFTLAIKNKSRQSQLIRGSIYWLNILSTLSRAARIAWIIQTALLLIILNHKDIKKLILYGFVPMIILLWWFTYWAQDDIINRNFSNLWHIKHTMTAIQKVGQKPLLGRWPWSAWPASHHRKDVTNYNPENQYLQIRIEYGLLWFAWRMYLYLRLQILGYRSYRKLQNHKLSKEQRYWSRIIISLSLWLFGLTIEGFFLHSFVDRMIVYPSMLLFGICFAIYYKHFQHDYKNT